MMFAMLMNVISWVDNFVFDFSNNIIPMLTHLDLYRFFAWINQMIQKIDIKRAIIKTRELEDKMSDTPFIFVDTGSKHYFRGFSFYSIQFFVSYCSPVKGIVFMSKWLCHHFQLKKTEILVKSFILMCWKHRFPHNLIGENLSF